MGYKNYNVFRTIKFEDKQIKNSITALAIVMLSVLAVRTIFIPKSEFVFDLIYAAAVIWAFHKSYESLHQDYVSYAFLVFAMTLHNLNLYASSPLGIKFDHYMHFVGGLAIAIISDRFFVEKMGKAKKFLLILFFTLGVGALGEIIEWLGFTLLGFGEGMFCHGMGDEIEWSNAIIDMIFNGLGAITIGLFTMNTTKRPPSL